MQPEVLAQVVQWELETLPVIVKRLIGAKEYDALHTLFDILTAQPYVEGKRRSQLAPAFVATAQQLPAVYGSVPAAARLFTSSPATVLYIFRSFSALYIERIIPPLCEHAIKPVLARTAQALFDGLYFPVGLFKADFPDALSCLEFAAHMVVPITDTLLSRRAASGDTAQAARTLLQGYLALLPYFPDRPAVIDQPVRLLTRYILRASTVKLFYTSHYSLEKLPADIIEKVALECIEDPPYHRSDSRYRLLFETLQKLSNTPDHIKVAIELILSRA